MAFTAFATSGISGWEADFTLKVMRRNSASRMTVQALHLNGHQICHGGFIFTLADSTFAFACNSYNKNAVAAGCSIEFLKPGKLGDVLTLQHFRDILAEPSLVRGIVNTILIGVIGGAIAVACYSAIARLPQTSPFLLHE